MAADRVVVFVVFDGMKLLDAAGPAEVFAEANRFGASYRVVMASVANGGSADDIAPGVDYFAKLKDAGSFIPVDPTSATIESGQTPVVFDWDYLNAAESAKLDNWKVYVPEEAPIAGYYFQAIKDRKSVV